MTGTVTVLNRINALVQQQQADAKRIAELDAALATAREDALKEAAQVAETTTAAPAQYNAKDHWRAEIGREVAAARRAMKGGE